MGGSVQESVRSQHEPGEIALNSGLFAPDGSAQERHVQRAQPATVVAAAMQEMIAIVSTAICQLTCNRHFGSDQWLKG